MVEFSVLLFHFCRSSCIIKVVGLVFFNPLSDIRQDWCSHRFFSVERSTKVP